MNLSGLLFLIGGGLLAWLAVRTIRHNPIAFSKINLSNSFYTLGLLTLMIIGVVAFCVMLLKSF